MRGGLKPSEHHQTSSFARSRRTEHREEFACGDIKVQILYDKGLPVIAFLDPFKTYEWVVGLNHD